MKYKNNGHIYEAKRNFIHGAEYTKGKKYYAKKETRNAHNGTKKKITYMSVMSFESPNKEIDSFDEKKFNTYFNHYKPSSFTQLMPTSFDLGYSEAINNIFFMTSTLGIFGALIMFMVFLDNSSPLLTSKYTWIGFGLLSFCVIEFVYFRRMHFYKKSNTEFFMDFTFKDALVTKFRSFFFGLFLVITIVPLTISLGVLIKGIYDYALWILLVIGGIVSIVAIVWLYVYINYVLVRGKK
jgi:hypothetical protein